MSIACIIFFAGNSCLGQPAGKSNSRIGIDLTAGLCFRTAGLMASHSFRPGWSAGFEVALDMSLIEKPVSNIDSEHRETVEDGYWNTHAGNRFRDSFLELSIHVDYWTSEAFKGLHFCIGGIIKDRGWPDFLLGAGYTIHIWKGLSADIMYRFGIIETYIAKQPPLEGIKAGLYYAF